MKKRTVGEIYSTIGAPFWLSIMSAYSGLNSRYPFQFFFSSAAAILTLPLAPFAAMGSDILQECDREDFEKETSNLPKVMLPEHYAYIDNDREDEVKTWYAIIDYSDEGFYECSSEQEARNFLLSKGYQEVVALDHPNHLDTYWIKDD